MTRTLLTLLLTALLAGCTIGRRGEMSPLALSPRGANIELDTRGGSRLRGELLEVRDAALLVLAENRVTLVPHDVVRGGRAENGPRGLTAQRLRTDGVRDRLRRISRFPHGITPEVEAELLRAYGQSSPVTVQP